MTSINRIHFINFSRRLTIHTVFFLVPLYFLQLGFNGWQIGIITSLFAFAPLLFSFPIGWINDRFSIKNIIQGALLILVFFFFIVGTIKNFLLMALLFLLLGLANSSLDISVNSVYYKDETQLNPNKKYGLLNFWLCLGMAIGVFIGGILTYWGNFNLLFIVYGIFLSLVFLFSRNLPEVRFHHISIKEYQLELINKKTVYFSLLIFILTLHWGAEQTVYSPFLRTGFHLNDFQLALYISLSLFALSLASYVISFLKFNTHLNEKIFLISMFFSGIGQIFMVYGNVYQSFFFRFIHELGDGFISALLFIYISRLFKKKSIGGSSGILTAVMTLGHVVGALVFSPLGYNFGLHYPFLISGGLLLANTAFVAYLFKSEEY